MKFTPARRKKIIDLIRAGNYKETAALSSGIDESTLYIWLKRGQEEGEKDIDSDYVKFFKAVKRAESEAESRNVMVIQQAAIDTWQAAAWWLERTKRKKYGRFEKKEIEVVPKEIEEELEKIFGQNFTDDQ